MNDTYKKAGVDIELANSIINKVKPLIHSTNIPGVVSEIGNFAGLFSLSQEKLTDPILVSGTDGVGTKLMIANLINKHDTIGIDLVAMCVNDILTCGAKPLFFLDYLATGKLEEQKMIKIITGITEGCKQAGCALLGGETAEMPGFYPEGEYDLSGFAVGVVERNKIIDGKKIESGNILIGLPSSGLHSNGFSLVRKIFLDKEKMVLNKVVPGFTVTLGEELIKPTRIYVKSVLNLLNKYQINGLVHITGGGFCENIPRIIPEDLAVRINSNSWPILPIFKLIQEKAKISDREMFTTFNMGIGIIIVIKPEDKNGLIEFLKETGETSYEIGEVIAKTENKKKVIITR